MARKKIDRIIYENRILESLKEKPLTTSLISSKSKIAYRELLILLNDLTIQGKIKRIEIPNPKIMYQLGELK